ncbi:MAG: hypothetical protein MJ154_03400 [Candidatus Saccharibacteria bacterium]|nr:hypothetical protein [Candidatus Saccharibacteria bacterium]
METIDQDPNDIVLQGPAKSNSGMIFKITTGIFAVTTVVFAIMAFTGGNKSTEPEAAKDNNTSTSQNTSSEPSEATPDLALKNFDVKIGKMVGGAGFNSGSILNIKTNADGTYITGEIKSGDAYGYTYRSLPSGEWQKTPISSDGKTYCNEISEEIMKAFAGITFAGPGNAELSCIVDETGEDEEDEEPADPVSYKFTEAIKEELYK